VIARALAHGPKEIELKLEFDPADAGRLLSHPMLEACKGAPDERELISIYYDTDDGALRKAGVFLRVRQTGGRFVQTIKSARSEAELIERLEWEQEVLIPEPDLGAAHGTALAPLLTPEVRATLRPRFETRFRRNTYLIERDDSEIEVAVDRGDIIAGAHRRPISELELELKRGHRGELFRLARDLARTVPLSLAVKAKAERGFELIDGGDHGVEKAGDIDVTPDMTSGDAFQVIARSCIRQIIANQPAVCDGWPEALHQMRIGLRRLRVAISLFADVVTDKDLDRIKGELRWITRELGPARDLDVFAAEVLEPLKAAHPDDDDVAATHRVFEEKRAAAYARAADAVRSDRFRQALLRLAEWVEVGAWAAEDDRKAPRSRPITEHAEKDLSRRRRRIRKRGKRLRDLSVGQRHRLRIRAKRLRYATEFFASTFDGETSEKRRAESLEALKDLQDALGALNDLATRQTLLAAHAHGLGDAGADEAKQLDKAKHAYARFAGVKAFWKA
jgi:inorganic triphosphatase YgiF